MERKHTLCLQKLPVLLWNDDSASYDERTHSKFHGKLGTSIWPLVVLSKESVITVCLSLCAFLKLPRLPTAAALE